MLPRFQTDVVGKGTWVDRCEANVPVSIDLLRHPLRRRRQAPLLEDDSGTGRAGEKEGAVDHSQHDPETVPECAAGGPPSF